MAGIIKQTGQSARDLAIKAAKQAAREPFEILKTAKEQVTPSEVQKGQHIEQKPQAPIQNEAQKAERDKMKSQRLYEALQREVQDIEHQDVFSRIQSKIAGGEKVPLEEYPELTREQREVLSAQMKAIEEQKRVEAAEALSGPPIVTTKHDRRMGPTRKQEAQKQQQRVEKPVPPSG